jgi:hypothetical protein
MATDAKTGYAHISTEYAEHAQAFADGLLRREEVR